MQLLEGAQMFLFSYSSKCIWNKCLACATCASMTSTSMKDCIRKIFGDPSVCEGENNDPSVNSKPVLITDKSALQGSWGHAEMQKQKGRDYSNSFKSGATGTCSIIIGRDGKVLSCFKCNSMQQFSRYCNYQSGIVSDKRKFIFLWIWS